MTVEDLVRLLQHLHQAFGFLPESHYEILGNCEGSATLAASSSEAQQMVSVDLRLIFSFEAVAMTIDLEAVGLWILKPIICIAELCLLILRPRRECQSLLWSRQRKRSQWDTA